MNRINQVVCALFAGVWMLPLAAQQFAYPAKGQTADQQKKDEYECYQWATQQSGFDPQKAAQQPAPPPQQQAAAPARGGRVKGAAKGAAAGSVVGHVGDVDSTDATRAGAAVGAMKGGAEQRKQRGAQQQAAAQQQQAATQQQQSGQANFQKARTACLEGRGYTVK
jgi:hypothetical protein